MFLKEAVDLFQRGRDAVDGGNTSFAIVCMEKAAVLLSSLPEFRSYYAVCLAREKGEYEEAERLCLELIEQEPKQSVHYLNLGRVLVAAGKKREAIRAFRDGLLHERNVLIGRELEKLGWRKVPVIRSLPREHPLNRTLGKISRKLRLR